MSLSLQDNAVRHTIQVFVASSAAMVVGTMISPQRWYWALIAAFIVGVGAASRSEVLVKGLQRSAGTLLGIVAGIGLATLVSGHNILAAGLAFASAFCAFYAFQTAYATMTFFITLMLALVYSLLGQFEPGLLVLRLEETVAGAAIGIAANYLVLPIRQSNAYADALEDFLKALAEVISHADRARPDSEAIAVLQEAKQALRQSLGGVKRGWVPLVGKKYLLANRAALRCAWLASEVARTGALDEESADALARRVREMKLGEEGESVEGYDEAPGFTPILASAIQRLGARLGDLPPDPRPSAR